MKPYDMAVRGVMKHEDISSSGGGRIGEHFPDATALVTDIVAGRISSRDLLEQQVKRIEASNARFNAVVAMNLDQARKQADNADHAVRNGERLGPLHGLPITLKDTWEMPGMPCTAGAPEWRDHRPQRPAIAVQRLLSAGAIVFGKTNVPYMASDIQSFNKVYGTTRNPLNPLLTPGGSSGGAAAALAAGFTSLELGSDLAGSIRIPAHYCGIHGHKSSYGVIPLRGHMPGPPGTLSTPPMAVAGPMARSARDLRLMMDVLTTTTTESLIPTPVLNEQQPRAFSSYRALSSYRVLLWLDDDFCPVDPAMVATYRQWADTLKNAGAQVTIGGPSGVSLDEIFSRYMLTLGSMMGVPLPASQRQLMAAARHLLPLANKIAGRFGSPLPPHLDKYLQGIAISYADARRLEESTLRLGEKLAALFSQYDVILMPPACTTAIEHNQLPAMPMRKITVAGSSRDYMALFPWASFASLLGLPATSVPIGYCSDGRPVNIQVVGPRYGDYIALAFAEAIA